VFTIHVNIDGLEHKLDTLADSAKDLEEPLRIFGGYLRQRAIERYKAQGFPPLAKATLEARADKALAGLENKLRQDLKKALKRQPQARRSLLEKLVGARVPEGMAGGSALSKGAASRLAVYQEFRARHRKPSGDNKFEQMAGAKDLSLKQLASLDAREGRAIAKAVSGPILGKLVKSLKVTVGSGSVTLASRTVTGFSEIHNEGGTAGRGSKIPKRETILIEEKDLDVLADIVLHHLTEGMQGPAVKS
jgi:phage gpG-like protein